MKLQFAALFTMVAAMAVVLCWTGSQQASADDAAIIAASSLTLPSTALINEEYTYVGSKKCKKCHIKVYKSWEKTAKGENVFETLKPGNAAEAKSAHNLDPAKDYTKDESCLACHTTGFGHEGGYFVPDESDKKAVKDAAKLAHVGCESCHGPGSAYIKVFEDIQKSKRQYDPEELHAKGLAKMGADVCMKCHNAKSPTFDPKAGAFNYEEMVKKGTHDHEELKLRK